MLDVTELAQGRWYELLIHFGIPEIYLRNKHGPCPLCEGKDRFRWDDRNGDGMYFCNSCGAGNGIGLAMKYTNRDFRSIAKEIEKMSGTIEPVEQKPKKDPTIRLNGVRKMIKKVTSDTPVALYLKSRGISKGNSTLGYIREYPYYEDGKEVGKFPVMACPITNVSGGLVSYHLTYLTGCGKKIAYPSPKKVLPPNGTIKGGSIKFGSGPNVCIAEGIENTLAAMAEYGMSGLCALNANGMESIEIPDYVNAILIIADNDRNYTGQKAAYHLANRLSISRTLEFVDVFVPFNKGDDFLDMAFPVG